MEYGMVEPMEDQDKLGGSGDIWEYRCDIVVQGDWEDRDDDFRFEMVNEGSDMGGRTWDHFCDVSAMISCPHDQGGGICVQLCIYAFRIIWIVVYDVEGCHMSVVIDPGEVNCVCSCVMNFMMFLVYF